MMVENDETLVLRAQNGDMTALDTLVRNHQSWVFNLALRMVWRRDVAEDAAQEILIKAVTHLGSFEGRSKFSTWLHRIAVNHLLNVRKSEMEEKSMTFTDMAASLEGVQDEELPDSKALPVETHLLVEEARLGCITAMLMCLERRQRLAFILGEVFGESSETAAAALEVTPANFRQLLSRARQDLYQFMHDKCGLVNRANPCRCARKASGFMRAGWLDPANLQFTKDRIHSVRQQSAALLSELEGMDREHAELYRAQPMLTGPDLAARLRSLVQQSGFSVE
ncbi:RNA polymerase sigma factor [Prosthecobacter vanneervenii]|uniref:RNA polymerase sigma factor (Sigma-70 family) n=1 Tax=Prosthecobacter vanneervenii TaxID=48466 RepID=A0A7W8DLF5_9BACT|nr:RNA polymerase sigma factor [Prosthecobacter vanneervenii]MBB5033995.1 RNA polymerase sigma factor (sigma-70 family) [Prosthecobacter vanneervenii]